MQERHVSDSKSGCRRHPSTLKSELMTHTLVWSDIHHIFHSIFCIAVLLSRRQVKLFYSERSQDLSVDIKFKSNNMPLHKVHTQ